MLSIFLALLLILPGAPAAYAGVVTEGELQALHLADAERIALRDNHDAALARMAIDAAAAAQQIAAAAPNPSLTVQTAGFNRRLGIGSGDLRSKTVDTSVRIDQLVERGQKRALRSQNAALLSDAAVFDAADTSRQVRLATRQAYYDLLAARDKVVIVDQTAALYDATLGAARKRQRAGDLAPSDVVRLQVDALRAINDAVQARADVARARRLLALLMGHPEVADAIVAADAWPVPTGAPVVNVASLVNERSDVRAAASRVHAAEHARRLALALRTRDVSVGVQADHYPTSANNQQGAGNSFSISLQIPLFIRYEFNGEIRAADTALTSANETLQTVTDAARSDVLRILEEWQTAAERLTRYQEELLPAATKSAGAAEFAFAHGAIGIMDVLDVRRTLRQTQLETLVARADFAKAHSAPLQPDSEKTLP